MSDALWKKRVRYIGGGLLWILALLFFVGIFAVRGAFQEPYKAAPADLVAPPLHTGSDFQVKFGRLGAEDFFIGRLGTVAGTAIPEIRHKTAVQDSPNVTVFCDPGFFLLSCYGSRELTAADNCSEEWCTLLGTVPIDAVGETYSGRIVGFEYDENGYPTIPIYQVATGCKVGIVQQDAGQEAVVHADCVRWYPE